MTSWEKSRTFARKEWRVCPATSTSVLQGSANNFKVPFFFIWISKSENFAYSLAKVSIIKRKKIQVEVLIDGWGIVRIKSWNFEILETEKSKKSQGIEI